MFGIYGEGKTISKQREVDTVEPGRWRDSKSSGLYLIVRPNGVRRWAYRYTRPTTGRVTEMGLGCKSLKHARDMAQFLSAKVATGGDPISEDHAQREAQREAEAAQTTFREAADAWITKEAPGWRGESAVRNARLLLHGHGKPLASAPVGAITPAMIHSVLAKLWEEHPAQARRALAMFERVLDYAEAMEWRTGANAARWKGCQQPRWPKRPKGDEAQFTALPYVQIPDFIRALRQHQARSTAAVALEFCILTASRTSETLGNAVERDRLG